MQKGTTTVPGPNRVSQGYQRLGQWLTKEAERTATTQNSSSRAHELRAMETDHLKNSQRTSLGSKQSSKELSVHSSKTKEDFPSRTVSWPSTRQTATSPSEKKAIETTNVWSHTRSTPRATSEKQQAQHTSTPKKTGSIIMKCAPIAQERRGNHHLAWVQSQKKIMTIKYRFKETGPHTFQEGDIVELQVSFIVVPLREQKSRMNVILRSITLLEGKFTQVRY